MSHSDMYNPKPREVWCPKCNTYTTRDDAYPRCENLISISELFSKICGEKLITVVYSVMTGERLTGNVKK